MIGPFSDVNLIKIQHFLKFSSRKITFFAFFSTLHHFSQQFFPAERGKICRRNVQNRERSAAAVGSEAHCCTGVCHEHIGGRFRIAAPFTAEFDQCGISVSGSPGGDDTAVVRKSGIFLIQFLLGKLTLK